MRRPRVFCPRLCEGTLNLPLEEAHHLSSVLRLGAGDTVTLFDGAGNEAAGVIRSINRRDVVVQCESVTPRPFDAELHLTLAVAVGRSHRQGYLVEKCTELSVGAIQPLLTTRSVTKPGASAVARWSRRAIEAAKQCGRSWVPEILPPSDMATVLNDCAGYGWVGVADAGTGTTTLTRAISSVASGSRILVFVGPEGGFGKAELEQLSDAGAVPVRLAPNILRTETAAVVVCATVCMRESDRQTG